MNRIFPQLVFWFIWISSIWPLCIYAQHLDFQYLITTKDGLSSGHVKDILFDYQDQLWIATSYGLNKYDGTDLTNYFYNPLDTNSISANSIERIFEGPDHNIWAILSVGGVCQYHIGMNKFTFHHPESRNTSSGASYIRDLKWDHRGNCYLLTFDGLYLLSCGAPEYQRIINQPDTIITQIDVVGGVLWMSTLGGVYYYIDGKLTPVDPEPSYYIQPFDKFSVVFGNKQKLKKWDRYQGLSLLKIFQTHEPSELFQNYGQVCLYSNQDTIIDYHFQSEILTDIAAGTELSMIPTRNSFPLFVDEHFGIWKIENCGLRYQGTLANQERPSQVIIHQQLETMVVSHTGGLSVYRISQEPSPLMDLHIGKINHIFNQGQVLILSTKNGVYAYDLINSKLSRHYLPNDSEVFFSYCDQNNTWWYGLDSGVFEVRANTKSVLHLPEYKVTQIDRDQYGHIWFLTNNGVTVYDHYSWHHLSQNKDELPTKFLRTLNIDKDGKIWIGSEKYGLLEILYNSPQGEIDKGFSFEFFTYKGNRRNPFQSNTVNKIVCWQDDLILGNYSAGILRFDRKSKKFHPYLFLQETPMHNVNNLIIGPDSCLWFTCMEGFFKLNLETHKMKRVQLPYAGEIVFHPGTTVRVDSQLFFGTSLGLLHYDVSQTQSSNSIIPMVHFRKVYVNGKEENLTSQIPIRLNHNENNVQIRYGIVDYFDPEAILYQYHLDGFYDNWQQVGAQTQLHFASLPPGKYMFKVKASGADYQWDDRYSSFAFIILPPFWETWIFRILAAALGIGIITLFISLKLNAKTREIMISEKIREKAAADFHDEMGNRIARLSLFAEILEKSMLNPTPETALYLQRVQSTATDIHHVMRDFLWALDPEKDRASDLAILIKDFGEELFNGTGINFRSMPIPKDFEQIVLSLDIKRHSLMIFKEAMTNVIKHAHAENISLSFGIRGKHFITELIDDGKGIIPQNYGKGLGLNNMKKRAENINGKLEIIQNKMGGTTIVLYCKR